MLSMCERSISQNSKPYREKYLGSCYNWWVKYSWNGHNCSMREVCPMHSGHRGLLTQHCPVCSQSMQSVLWMDRRASDVTITTFVQSENTLYPMASYWCIVIGHGTKYAIPDAPISVEAMTADFPKYGICIPMFHKGLTQLCKDHIWSSTLKHNFFFNSLLWGYPRSARLNVCLLLRAIKVNIHKYLYSGNHGDLILMFLWDEIYFRQTWNKVSFQTAKQTY